MTDDNAFALPTLTDLPTTYAILASQRSEIEKLGVTCSTEKVGYLNTFGGELVLPVTCFEHASLGNLISDMLAQHADGPSSICLVEGKECLFIAFKDGIVSKEALYPDQDDPPEWSDLFIERVLSDIREFAKCVGGVTVQLHAPTSSKFHEPLRDVAGVFHLFLLTTPSPGRNDQHFPQEIFGVSVETPAGFYSHFHPTPGRGVMLSEGSLCIAQIIGNNIYLPWDPITLMAGNAENGRTVFRKSLRLIFNYLLSDKKTVGNDAGVDTSPTEENVRAQIDSFAEKVFVDVRKRLAGYVKKVQEKEEKLRILRLDFSETKRLYAFLTERDFWTGTLRTNLTRDREKILAHAKVACMRIIPEHGFEVDSNEIVIAHNGKRFPIGTFTMRFGFDGTFRIWPIVSHHPKRVPHPHISAWSGPCFGNVNDVIDAAIAEYRYGDAVDYLIDWLENGYSPELVLWSKVEEWPIEVKPQRRAHERKRTTELFPAKQLIRPNTCKADTPNRRGVGGKPRRK